MSEYTNENHGFGQPEGAVILHTQEYSSAPVEQPIEPIEPQYNYPPQPGAYPPPFGGAPAQMGGYAPYGTQGQPHTYYGQPVPNGYPAPGAYTPYPQVQPKPKRKGGFFRVLGIVVGTLVGVVILAVAVGAAGELLRTSINTVPGSPASASSGGMESAPPSSGPALPGGSDSDPENSVSATPISPSENTDPNGAPLTIHAPPTDQTKILTSKEIAAKCKDSVVSISSFSSLTEQTPDTLFGEGTGIIMTADGYILTNSHVILDGDPSVSLLVTTSKQEKYAVKIVGFDVRTDLAVLKIDATNLKPAEFGDSSKLESGDPLVAIGSAGGSRFAGSVTAGIVSAVDRFGASELEGSVKYIQTDAAINPGNSGGPLINQYGQVIGVNVAKISSIDVEGMCFAIPSAIVKPIADDLVRKGYVTGRCRLGLSSKSAYDLVGLEKVVIIGFSDDSDFHNTQARVNDIIIQVDGQDIYTIYDVYAILENHKPGDVIQIKLYRQSILGGSFATEEESPEQYFTVSVKLLADQGQTQIPVEIEDSEGAR